MDFTLRLSRGREAIIKFINLLYNAQPLINLKLCVGAGIIIRVLGVWKIMESIHVIIPGRCCTGNKIMPAIFPRN
jgi:hypothetical protein